MEGINTQKLLDSIMNQVFDYAKPAAYSILIKALYEQGYEFDNNMGIVKVKKQNEQD